MNVEKAKRIKKRSKPKSHGTNSSYQNYNCRCESCTNAHRLVNREYYHKNVEITKRNAS